MSCSSDIFDGTNAVPSLLAVDLKDTADLRGDASRLRVCKTRQFHMHDGQMFIDIILTVFLS